MAANKKLIPFSLDSLHIVKMTKDDATGSAYGTELIQCEGVQEVSIAPIAEEYVLEGDGGIVDVQNVLEGFDIEFSNGVMTFRQLQELENATVEDILAEDGITVVGQRYVTKSTDKPQYFGLIGYVRSQNLKVVLLKCKVVSVELSFANKTHAVLSVTAKAIRRDFDKAFRYLQYTDAENAPTVADFE